MWPSPHRDRATPPGIRPPPHSGQARPPPPARAAPAGGSPRHPAVGCRTGTSCRGPRSRCPAPSTASAQEASQFLAIGRRALAVDRRVVPSWHPGSELEERLEILLRRESPDDVAERLPGSLQRGQRRVRVVAELHLFWHGINTYVLLTST